MSSDSNALGASMGAFRAAFSAVAGSEISADPKVARALDAGAAAFSATWSALTSSPSRNGETGEDRLPEIIARYREGSWKRDVLEIIGKLLEGDDREDAIFYFAEFQKFEKQLEKRHPEHNAIASGVAVTLQSLLNDKVIKRIARGVYRLA